MEEHSLGVLVQLWIAPQITPTDAITITQNAHWDLVQIEVHQGAISSSCTEGTVGRRTRMKPMGISTYVWIYFTTVLHMCTNMLPPISGAGIPGPKISFVDACFYTPKIMSNACPMQRHSHERATSSLRSPQPICSAFTIFALLHNIAFLASSFHHSHQ